MKLLLKKKQILKNAIVDERAKNTELEKENKELEEKLKKSEI